VLLDESVAAENGPPAPLGHTTSVSARPAMVVRDGILMLEQPSALRRDPVTVAVDGSASWRHAPAQECRPVTTIAGLALTLVYGPSGAGARFSAATDSSSKHAWAPSLGIEYHLGVDGLSALMLVLSAIVTLMSVDAAHRVHHQPGLYFALVLTLESGLFGSFTALNFFHWFLFWELSLIPAFFLIKLWGGTRRGPAATQFFIYTMAGSAALLSRFWQSSLRQAAWISLTSRYSPPPANSNNWSRRTWGQ